MIFKEVSRDSRRSYAQSPAEVAEPPHPPDPLAHLLSVVDVRELSLGLRHSEELAERRPALLHLEDEEPLSRDLSLHLLHPVVEEGDGGVLAAVHGPEHAPGVAGPEVGGGPAGEHCGVSSSSLDKVDQPVQFYICNVQVIKVSPEWSS